MKYEIGIVGCFHDVDFRNILNKQQYPLFWDLLLVHFVGSFLSKQTRWEYLTCSQTFFPGLYSQRLWQCFLEFGGKENEAKIPQASLK